MNNKAKKASAKTQAQRLLAAKKAQTDAGGQGFARSVGKATLARNGRKPSRMG